MEARGSTQAQLDQARAGAAERAWDRAWEALAAVDEHELAAADLELFARAAFWTGRSIRSISLREAAYAAHLEDGDTTRAALCALTLRREHLANLQDAVAAGWLQRAEQLLEGRPESFADTSAADGYLAIAHADGARARGDFARALSMIDRALGIADGSGDRDLRAWATMRRGLFLADEGRLTEGTRLMEQVAASAAAGELGGYTTGAVFANAMGLCRDLADHRRGLEWSDTASRWLGRQRIRGFPGVLRINRAELLRSLGDLRAAEGEAVGACEELDGFSVVHLGLAQHELGEIRLRLGDLDGAETAFARARELGEDPNPGLALLHLAREDGMGASVAIGRGLEGAAFDGFARARLLSAQAQIAGASCDIERAAEAWDRLQELGERVASPGVRAAAAWAGGLVALNAEDADAASIRLREARDGWIGISAPYETAKVELALADASLLRGDRDGAETHLRTAREAFERIGAALEAERAADRIRRLPGEGSPSRIVRTFVFTDIVDSTSLLSLIGDEAWDDLRRWHDETLRAAFAAYGGEEIDHAGDGFFVAFPDTASALGSAIEIQRGLMEHRRAHGFAPQVRIGVHATGATHDGTDYTGIGVHTAARIGALAGPGEIVASASTLEDVPGVRPVETRAAELKGIAGPVEVAVVDWREEGSP
ncbi:MAG: adenylate/guanylate cyclase domain-containing protein [Actinomycetota bacterium]